MGREMSRWVGRAPVVSRHVRNDTRRIAQTPMIVREMLVMSTEACNALNGSGVKSRHQALT